ncbi:MAG: glycoside hydrolase family 73 protein [Clostridia bacterium]|nr:glycoside hydrolase family 73 protein [Clostridia bacterium]
MDKQTFINSIKNGAIKAYQQYNILPSLTIAQAILESNWGKSVHGNMLFGIKWTAGCGYDYQLLWTSEYIDGKWVRVQAKFRKYDSYDQSIEDHSKLLMLDRYVKVRQAKDYKLACTEVWKCGYATDPNYPQKLIEIIEYNNLQKYDVEAKAADVANDEVVSEWARVAWNKAVEKRVNDGLNPKGNVTEEQLMLFFDKLGLLD